MRLHAREPSSARRPAARRTGEPRQRPALRRRAVPVLPAALLHRADHADGLSAARPRGPACRRSRGAARRPAALLRHARGGGATVHAAHRQGRAAFGARPRVVLPREDPLSARPASRRTCRARAHRRRASGRAGRRPPPAAREPADGRWRLRRRSLRAGRHGEAQERRQNARRTRGEQRDRAVRPLQPRRLAHQDRRPGRRHRTPRRTRPRPGGERRSAQPARPGQRGAGLCRAAGQPTRAGAHLP